ncbi:MAG: penicillin-binding transpeptidase domain-containing protein [Leptonema sp. (in: bacteria)]
MFSEKKLIFKRFYLLNFLFFIFLVILISRIIYLSRIFVETNKKENKQILRGAITDRRGIHLAITEEASTIMIKPSEVLDIELTAKYLAGYLNLEYNEVLQKFYLNQNKNFFLLERKTDNYISELIIELNLPGVYRNFEYKRIYPSNQLASNLIGFVRKDTLEGLGGIEAIYNDILNTSFNHFNGPTIELSIDVLIQNEFEKVLKELFENSKTQKGIGIMMDLESGEILALVNLPNYDPNLYYKENVKEKHNWAISFPIEPGSLMKPIFAAMVLNDKPELLHHTVECKGEYHFKTGSIRCLRKNKIFAHGTVDIEKILVDSCNVGIIQLSKNLEKNNIYKYLLELGFGQKTNVVPSNWEHAGYIPKLDQWVESTQYYLPIGQGFLATPIQIITALSALVNNGMIVKPILIKKIYSEKKTIQSTGLQIRATSLRKKTLDSIQKSLFNVIEKGTGKLAKVDFMKVIGKTGTSQKSSPFGYTNLYTASFFGAFPYPNPKYSVLIIFDGVSEEYSGGNLSALAFSHFLNHIKRILISTDFQQRIDLKQTIPKKNIQFIENEIPNFKDFSLKDVLNWKKTVLDVYNENQKEAIIMEIYGNGYVIQQFPEKGTSLKKIKKIQVYLSEEEF